MANLSRRRGPPASLRIDTPAHNPLVALAQGDSSASALSSATSDSDHSPFFSSAKPKSLRNMKKLSLTLPSAQSSNNSLQLHSEPQSAVSVAAPEPLRHDRPRRPSIISLPATANPTANSLIHRKEDGEDAVPYLDGPTQIIPGVWLGSEDNARDWKGLIERGIKSVLNVAKEVAAPLDAGHISQPLRSVSSAPNFKKPRNPDSTYHPPNLATGRPGMHYLKLQWSHGQQDLVDVGFQAAMAFTDAALERGEGVLVHCQCGISRSATLVIALVMRAAAEQSPSVPPEVWALKGMQGAYSFVKEKSKWVGPNMSLIYQLLEYEKKLKGDTGSPSGSDRSSYADEEEEWGRRRKLLDEAPSDGEEERESTFVMREAEALDKAMEERMVARKSSASSLASSTNSGVGMGAAWRTRYGHSRKRAGSIASNMTNGSMISEDLVEEEEEEELLGVGGGFDGRSLSAEPEDSSATNSPDDEIDTAPSLNLFAPTTARPSAAARPAVWAPPSAPVWKTSFNIATPPTSALRSTFNIPPPPSSAVRSTFNIPSRPPPKGKRRPAPIGILPPVPSSPIAIVVESTSPPETLVQSNEPSKPLPLRTPTLSLPPVRLRTESKKLPPPLHLRNSLLKKTNVVSDASASVSTPSQTLFVFPPSPTLTTRTPSTMTLTSNMGGLIPFPSLATPRVSTFRSQGRTRSFIGLGAPPTPTIAFSKVDARGYVGLQ
ncbi:hypothetical protein D9615_005243 [Tricholomella constricta]|uniref:protein-tyrosine-phosphatase n=1 Tax=Tricholomella constricta TaxID=117010 RepID=A0A8H5M1M5_9AGAR|nr:hypothetical protein D9615_005243 [Tricholomella constricta]